MTAQGKLAAAYTRAGFGEQAYQQRLAQMNIQQGGEWVTTGTEPLTANQHILHLLLTVFTVGLWAPVWIVRSAQGNKRRVWQPASASAGASGARPRPL
jgi:hypothetical protein